MNSGPSPVYVLFYFFVWSSRMRKSVFLLLSILTFVFCFSAFHNISSLSVSPLPGQKSAFSLERSLWTSQWLQFHFFYFSFCHFLIYKTSASLQRKQTWVQGGWEWEKFTIEEEFCVCRVTFVEINDLRLSVSVDLLFQQVVLVVWNNTWRKSKHAHTLETFCLHFTLAF